MQDLLKSQYANLQDENKRLRELVANLLGYIPCLEHCEECKIQEILNSHAEMLKVI